MGIILDQSPIYWIDSNVYNHSGISIKAILEPLFLRDETLLKELRAVSIVKKLPRRLFTSLLLFALLQGCAVGPNYTQPDIKTPDAWNQELMKGFKEGKASLQAWWTTFDDPVLSKLIERARKGSLRLKEAVARIQFTRAQRGIAAGEQVPSVDGVGGVERSRLSEGISRVVPPPQDRTDNFYSAGIDSTWEIDLFGRIRRSVESADALLGASGENYRDALVSLFSEVALNYIDTRTLQERIRIAVANVETQRGSLKLTRDRFRAEIAPELDVAQAESNLATTEATIPTLEIRLTQAVNRIAVLLGQNPGTLQSELRPEASIPAPQEQVALGLPVNLLRQRPDIRRAERELAAQTARVGVATADLYPRFSLTGAFAFESAQGSLSGIFNSSNRAWSFGPSFRWNLFDGFRVRNRINAEEALVQESLVRYERTILNAFEEVENSLVGYTRERVRRDALSRAVAATERTVRLVKQRYLAGLTDFQNVLDAERSLLQLQDQLAASKGELAKNLVGIYRAIGGGWSSNRQLLNVNAGLLQNGQNDGAQEQPLKR
jgi:NodT family efflux transporter outer membrane factor (OMF) lipoprotein